MTIRVDVIPASLPGLHAFRWTCDELFTGMKEAWVIGRVESGRSVWQTGTKVARSEPGSVHVNRPGDVHRAVASDGVVSVCVVSLPAALFEGVTERARARSLPAAAPEAAPFHRLHDAVRVGADRLTLEVAVTEAIHAITTIDVAGDFTRAVRRGIDLLRAKVDGTVTLDELAAHVGLDKFHFCHAFRAQVGMAPHAYLTRLRIMRAKQLLIGGMKPSEVAVHVGLYDQSQLNRHFRRVVGTTPAQYARAVAAHS